MSERGMISGISVRSNAWRSFSCSLSTLQAYTVTVSSPCGASRGAVAGAVTLEQQSDKCP